jgi:hypothetical protein
VFAMLGIVATFINGGRYIVLTFPRAIHPVALETNGVVGCWIPNNNKIRPAGEADLGKTDITRVGP